MVDFAYYTDTFSGTLLTQDEFENLEPRASDYVKFYIGHNFKECDEGISRTFESGDISRCADRAIAMYLAETGLLYRGI